jgi:hypothetical protein
MTNQRESPLALKGPWVVDLTPTLEFVGIYISGTSGTCRSATPAGKTRLA